MSIEQEASQGKKRVPPVIEIAGNLYLVEDWDIDEGVGDTFTLSRLSKKEGLAGNGIMRLASCVDSVFYIRFHSRLL